MATNRRNQKTAQYNLLIGKLNEHSVLSPPLDLLEEGGCCDGLSKARAFYEKQDRRDEFYFFIQS